MIKLGEGMEGLPFCSKENDFLCQIDRSLNKAFFPTNLLSYEVHKKAATIQKLSQ